MNKVELITELFDLGGLIAGGFATSQLFNYKGEAKDLDFFFNNYNSYKTAFEYIDYNLDIVYYQGQEPYDSFDLSISKCYLDRNGKLSLSKECLDSYHSGIIRINRESIFNPRGTIRRLYKYKHKFGLEIDSDDLKFIKDKFSV